MEGKLQMLDHESLTQSPVKRKPDLVPAEEWDDETTMKQEKADAIPEELGDAGQDDKKGKSIFTLADKGKWKMAVDEEEGSDDDDDSRDDEDGIDFINDSDFTDDALTEIDAENILPGRTRPRVVGEPGTYRLDDDGTDEDDYTEKEDEDEEEEEENEEEEGEKSEEEGEGEEESEESE